MKRVSFKLLAVSLVLLLALAGCGGGTSTQNQGGTPPADQGGQTNQAPPPRSP
ncbi:conserved exported hypothetical protein [[Clostridium] ultunense Esp]|nr:conserved exported hypothetical protein [[Clostridium] ultunense Esp]